MPESYDMFLSYSRQDVAVGRALQHSLQSFAKPWYRSRQLRIFRDETDLPLSPTLWEEIETALACSTWMLVLVSAHSVHSEGVNTEISMWRAARGGAGTNLLIATVDGELRWDKRVGNWAAGTAPAALSGAFAKEPIYADLRSRVQTIGGIEFADDVLATVLATVRGEPKDELVGTHLRLRRRTRQTVLGVLAFLTILVIGLAGVTWWALGEQRTADRQTQLAVSRKIAAESVALRRTQPATSMLLAAAAWRTAPTVEARSALLEAQVQQFAGQLRGHTDFLSGAAVDPAGAVLATSSLDGTVRLWDLRRRAPLAVLEGHAGAVNAVTFVPGQPGVVVSVGDDGTIRWWDTVSGREALRVGAGQRGIHGLAASPDGRLVATGGDDGTVQVRDSVTGTTVGATLSGHTEPVGTVTFSPDGQELATGGNDGIIRLWDVADHRLRQTLTGHRYFVDRIAYLGPPGSAPARLVSASHDGTGAIWDLATGERTVLAGHIDAVPGLAVSPDSGTVVTTGYDGTIRLWDVATGRPLREIVGHVGIVGGAVFTPDGRALVTFGTDHSAIIWDLAGNVYQHTDYVTALALSHDGRTLATGGRESVIRLWNVPDHRQLAELDAAGADGQVTSLAMNPDGTLLAGGGFGFHAQVWDLRTGRELATLGGGPSGPASGSVTEVAFSPDGRLLATGDFDGTLHVWDVDTFTQIYEATGHYGPINALTFAPDSATIVTAGNDLTVRLWDSVSGRETGMLSEPQRQAAGVAVSPDGQQVAAGGDDNTVRIWSVAGNREIAVLSGHTSAVDAVAFSPDGQVLASASWDATVRLWDARTFDPLATFAAHTKEVRGVAFADDSRIATVSNDGTAMIWDPGPDRLATVVCAKAGRDLSTQERAAYIPEMPSAVLCE